MADGKTAIGGVGGQTLLDADGREILVDPACCYRQGRVCGAEGFADAWVLASQVAHGAVRKIGSACFVFDGPLSMCPGTVVGAGDAADDCESCAEPQPIPCPQGSLLPAEFIVVVAGVVAIPCPGAHPAPEITDISGVNSTHTFTGGGGASASLGFGGEGTQYLNAPCTPPVYRRYVDTRGYVLAGGGDTGILEWTIGRTLAFGPAPTTELVVARFNYACVDGFFAITSGNLHSINASGGAAEILA